MKKPISALLAVSLIASMAVPAMADDNADTTTTSTTTVETPKATEEGAAEEGKEEAAKEEKAEEEAVKEEAVAEEAQDTVDGVQTRAITGVTVNITKNTVSVGNKQPVTVGTITPEGTADGTVNYTLAVTKGGSADTDTFEIEGTTIKTKGDLAAKAGEYKIKVTAADNSSGNKESDEQTVTIAAQELTTIELSASSENTKTVSDFKNAATKAVDLCTVTAKDQDDQDMTVSSYTVEAVKGEGSANQPEEAAKFAVDGGNLQAKAALDAAKYTITVKSGNKSAKFTLTVQSDDAGQTETEVTVAAKAEVENGATTVDLEATGNNLSGLEAKLNNKSQVVVTAPSGKKATVEVSTVAVASGKITLTFAADALTTAGNYTVKFGGDAGIKFGDADKYKLTTGSFTVKAKDVAPEELNKVIFTPATIDNLRVATAKAGTELTTVSANVTEDVTFEITEAKKDNTDDVKASFELKGDKLNIKTDLAAGKYSVTVKATKDSKTPTGKFTFTVEADPTGDQLNTVEMSATSATKKVKEAVKDTPLATITAKDATGQPIADGVTYEIVSATKDGADASAKFEIVEKELKIKENITETGTYTIKVKASKGNHSATATFTLTVEADTVVPPQPPTPPVTPDKPSHGGGGGGGRHEHPSTIKGDKTTSSTTTTTNKTSANVASNGEVSATDVAKQVAKEAAANTTVSVLVENAKTVSAAALKEMADAASAKGATAVLKADTVVNGVTEGRLYIDAAKGAALKADMALTVRTSSNEAKSVEKLFNKYFTNNVDVVTLSQKGKLEMNVKAAVKVDVSNMNTAALRAYYYDTTNNSYHLLPNANCTVDANGFVHFTTNMGGSIIITDSALAAK